MERRSNAFVVAVLVGIHLILALAYAVDTPYRTPGHYFTNGPNAIIPDIGAPDELQHVNNVQSFLDGKLPVLDIHDPNLGEHYQAHQPPLFYAIAAGWAKVFGLSDLKNRMAGLSLRLLNALIGSANVIGVFYLGWWGFHRRDVALCGAAFAALWPMNLALSGAVSNDPLLFCLCTWTLAVAALGLREGWTRKRTVVLGVLLGLAFLTKTTALGLVPALLIGAYFSGGQKPTLKKTLAVAVIAVLIALPWWARNQQLYGDPFAMKAFNQAFVGSPTRESLHWDWGTYLTMEWRYVSRSMVGMFGYVDIPLPENAYRVAWALLLILLLGTFLLLRRSEWRQYRPALILNGTFVGVVIIMFAAFNLRYFQGQARYLFPAIGPLSLFFGLGILYYGREKWQTSFVAWVVMLTLANLYLVSQILPAEFAARRL